LPDATDPAKAEVELSPYEAPMSPLGIIIPFFIVMLALNWKDFGRLD
jgi:hypothetical protein